MTMSGTVLGTLDFMPPEQRRDSSSVDERSDLWSLAATFYQMLTGKSPKVIRERDIPVNMRDLLMQALEEDPADRFSSAIDFKRALMSAASSVVVAPVKELTSGVCPACNAVNADNRKFCGECAESLRTVCLGCDIEMAVWDKICGECGARQSELKQQAVEKAAKITTALAKGDWEVLLALDPNNVEGLRMQTAAIEERTDILARAPTSNTIGMTLNLIPAGTFMMGSPETEGRKDDEPNTRSRSAKRSICKPRRLHRGSGWR
jgi:hypothetical protein